MEAGYYIVEKRNSEERTIIEHDGSTLYPIAWLGGDTMCSEKEMLEKYIIIKRITLED